MDDDTASRTTPGAGGGIEQPAYRAVTAHDVARMAKVSQSAVSRAFTPGTRISAATRARIIRISQQIGYRPNALARSLITNRSMLIGVAISRLTNLYTANFLDTLCRRLQAIGYHAVFFTTNSEDEPASPGLDEIMQYSVDGLLLASTVLPPAKIEAFRDRGVPVVLMNQTASTPDISSVAADNFRGGELAAAFLAAGGHRRFGFLAGPEASSSSREREQAFSGWLGRHGHPAPLRGTGNYAFSDAWAATRLLLARPDRPDALFCADDHMAIAAIEVARQEFGLRVGSDISIVGFEDVQAAAWPSYDLTTFAFDLGQMVDEILAILTAMVANPASAPRHTTVPGQLVVRSSARLPSHGISPAFDRRIWRHTELP